MSMDFVNRLPVFTNEKGETDNSILVIINWLIKIIFYQPIKVTIDILGQAEVIIDLVV